MVGERFGCFRACCAWPLTDPQTLTPHRCLSLPPSPFCLLPQGHAADTYAEFAEQNEALLRTIPPPLVALNYYKSGDLYLFDMFQTSWKANGELRRPTCK